MNARRWFLLLALLAGCATTPPGGVGRCPGSNQTGCLTREQCSYDATDNCMRCQCESAEMVPREAPLNPGQPPLPR